MLLSLLKSQVEQQFFVMFAYLVAVAEPDMSNLPPRLTASNAHDHFKMLDIEFQIINKFYNEVYIPQDDSIVSFIQNNYNSINYSFNKPENHKISAYKIGENPLFNNYASLNCNNIVELIDTISSQYLGDNIITDFNKITEAKNSILDISLKAILPKNIDSLDLISRKIMLLEATAMAYCDGNCSPEEELLLNNFCKYCAIDRSFVPTFENITRQFVELYKQCLELINN